MSEPCKECQERGKTWEGANPVCSFPDEGQFDSKGWNCALAGQIRDICHEGQDLPSWVDYQYCDDQNYATINLRRLQELDGNGYDLGLALWVSIPKT